MNRILDALKIAFNKTPDRLESMLLEHLLGALSAEAAEILKQQIAAINHVKRTLHRRDVTLCHMEFGVEAWGQIASFPRNDSELKLAAIMLSSGKEEKFRADVWLVRGHIYMIYFDKPPRKMGKVEDMKVLKVQVHVDPMIPVEDEPQAKFAIDEEIPILSRWLQEWREKYEICDVCKPMSLKYRMRRLKELETTLPEDYLELLDQTDGFVIRNNSVFGISDIYNVMLDDGDYYLIAEVACGEARQGFLGLVSGSNDNRIFYLVHDGPGPEDKGTSFQKAMEEFLG
jgi:hypothetical protein